MNTTPRPAVRTSSNLFPALSYDDAHAALVFLERAFGFQRRFIVPDEQGGIRHSEVSFGDGVIMVSRRRPSNTLARQRDRDRAPCTRRTASGARKPRSGTGGQRAGVRG